MSQIFKLQQFILDDRELLENIRWKIFVGKMEFIVLTV
ncbi:MAG: hypothetical protein ACI9CD_001238, partial [Candidatus Deianiraeaceae bacterium]